MKASIQKEDWAVVAQACFFAPSLCHLVSFIQFACGEWPSTGRGVVRASHICSPQKKPGKFFQRVWTLFHEISHCMMAIYIYIYLYIHTHTYIHTYIHTKCTYIHIYLHTAIHSCVDISTCSSLVCKQTDMYTGAYPCAQSQVLRIPWRLHYEHENADTCRHEK